MSGKVLVTGGAGFIGSHLVDALVREGKDVRVLDCLDPQVHGENSEPRNIAEHVAAGRVEFILGDVCDPDAVRRSMKGVSVVFHQAAAVGVGQSMYRIVDYVRTNTLGAAVMLESILEHKDRLERVVVASSMSIYGEGRYECPEHGEVFPNPRSSAQLSRREWEMGCPTCGAPTRPKPTDEEKPLNPTSIYAVTKRDHEEMFLSIGRAYEIPTVALRYFNVYGPRQSLNNPYTGVAAIFTSRILNGKAPLVYEDGRQSRDFLHVSDIVQANMLALTRNEAVGEVFNVGTGRSLSLLDMVEALRAQLGGPEPDIVHKFRQGDIRHCFGDISKISDRLGYAPRVRFEDGIDDLVAWAGGEKPVDRVDQARTELENIGLTL
jgi:dTDP-L-rhamnose 4-epimerase